MKDLVLVSADSVRRDYADRIPFVSDFDIRTGHTGAHYTRPSLASLLSPTFESVLRTRPLRPTLAEELAEEGYHCIGLGPGPQLDPEFGFDVGFDFYESFHSGTGNAFQNRRSGLREYLGSFDMVRRVYRRFYPLGAMLQAIPSDQELVDTAIKRFNAAESPRFLWIHFMGTHRPYGTGDEAVPRDIDRKSERLGGRGLFVPEQLTDEEHAVIEDKYTESLTRAGHQIQRLLDELDSDPIFWFCADHGEELGEDGFYYHQGYRRRVVDRLIEVPSVIAGLDIDANEHSLLDVAPTLVAATGRNPPDSWQGRNLLEHDPEWAITIAPWHEKATLRWTDFETTIVCRDADISLKNADGQVGSEQTEVDQELEERLQALGYRDAG